MLASTLADRDRTDTYNPQRWRRLAELYIAQGRIDMAENCAQHAGDLAFSLLLLSCLGDRAGLRALAEAAQRSGQLNVAFLALYLAGDAVACLNLLQEEGKLPEAAFFSLSYVPSQAHAAFTLWREKLRAEKHIAAELLADPAISADDLVIAQNDTFNYTSILQPFVTQMNNCWTPVENLGKGIRNGSVTHDNAQQQTDAMNEAMNSDGIS